MRTALVSLTEAQQAFARTHAVSEALESLAAAPAVFMYSVGPAFTERWLVPPDGRHVEHHRFRRCTSSAQSAMTPLMLAGADDDDDAVPLA